MKIYARQVNPEYQESPLFMGDESFPENIAVFGNCDFKEHIPEVVRRVRDVLNADELSEVLENVTKWKQWYKNITEVISDYLPPESGHKYTSRSIHALKIAVQDYAEACRSTEEDSAFLRVLDVVTGKKWACKDISGCVQCEWNRVFYPVAQWSPEALQGFECEYFNTGTEWIIHDGDENPESPEDISGYSFYATAWDTEGIRKAIADEAGATPADVVLFEYKGERIAPIYCEV